MKKIFVLVLTCFALFNTAFASPQDDAAMQEKFTGFLKQKIAMLQESYERGDYDIIHSRFGGYCKCSYTDLDVRVESIRSTNSLVKEGYIGEAVFSCKTVTYVDERGNEYFKTEQEAKNAVIPGQISSGKSVKFVFEYENGVWKVKSCLTTIAATGTISDQYYPDVETPMMRKIKNIK